MIMHCFQFPSLSSRFDFSLAFVCSLGLLYTSAYYSINAIVYRHNKLIKFKSNVEVNI